MECGTLTSMMALCDLDRLPQMPLQTVVRDLVNGLAYLHDNGVLHKVRARTLLSASRLLICPLSLLQDIKPSNVLVNAKAVCKLSDFGTSQHVEEAGVQEHQGGGTLPYMAPEVVQGTVCAKSDVWSLGITMMALVQGASPYEALPPLQMTAAIVSDDPVPALSCTDGYDADYLHLISLCTCKNLAQRVAVADLKAHMLVTYAPSRERSLLPIVEQCLKAKASVREQEERDRRRALVGGKKV